MSQNLNLQLDKVEVEWIDSASVTGWQDPEFIEDQLKKQVFCVCSSIGYLFRETDEYICLVSAINHNGDQVDNTFIIPKAVVRSIKKLRFK